MIFVGLVPTGGASGTVAELALSYRVPGSTERVTDTVAVTYPHDPRAPRDQPYLSYPGMAERFAMYNMFLAFQRATAFAADHYGCALAVLTEARTRAAGWLRTHEADQDLAADLALLDRFMANLRQRGAQDDAWLNDCAVGGPYVPHPPYDAGWTGPDHGHGHANPHDCTTGSGPGGLGGVAAVLLVLGRRRRRLA